MKYETNELKLEAAKRVTEASKLDIKEFEKEVMEVIADLKGAELILFHVSFNAEDEVFDILVVFSIYGTLCATYEIASVLRDRELKRKISDFIHGEWQSVRIPEPRRKEGLKSSTTLPCRNWHAVNDNEEFQQPAPEFDHEEVVEAAPMDQAALQRAIDAIQTIESHQQLRRLKSDVFAGIALIAVSIKVFFRAKFPKLFRRKPVPTARPQDMIARWQPQFIQMGDELYPNPLYRANAQNDANVAGIGPVNYAP